MKSDAICFFDNELLKGELQLRFAHQLKLESMIFLEIKQWEIKTNKLNNQLFDMNQSYGSITSKFWIRKLYSNLWITVPTKLNRLQNYLRSKAR